MSQLYLSRLLLPLDSSKVQRLLGDPYQLHLMVMRGFPSPPGRVLFRLEPMERNSNYATLLVQGERKPDWDAADLFKEIEISAVKAFELNAQAGHRLRFRLRANPTIKKFIEGKKNGTRVPVKGDEGRMTWLQRKAEHGGFKVLSALALDEGSTLGRKGPSKIALQSARYEGLLEVTEPGRFLEVVAEGLGSAKGMGFGLLSLAPA